MLQNFKTVIIILLNLLFISTNSNANITRISDFKFSESGSHYSYRETIVEAESGLVLISRHKIYTTVDSKEIFNYYNIDSFDWSIDDGYFYINTDNSVIQMHVNDGAGNALSDLECRP